MKIVSARVELLWNTPDPEKAIEVAARTCYKSEDRITETSHVALITHLLKRGHTAMFEFADACFRITCDRGVSHELVRHRIASFAQESTRYCNYSGKGIEVIYPPGLNDATTGEWFIAMTVAEERYCAMITADIPPQIARSVLPNSLKTEVVMKTNFRSWLNFLRLRTAPAAHPQMRQIADMVKDHLVALAPTVFAEFIKET
jgi:thymidylate synthase (FAD)